MSITMSVRHSQNQREMMVSTRVRVGVHFKERVRLMVRLYNKERVRVILKMRGRLESGKFQGQVQD